MKTTVVDNFTVVSWVDQSTFVIINRSTGEIVTASRNEDTAHKLGARISEFNLMYRFCVQEVTLH